MNFSEYRKKVTGCYLGKAVGGTLGMPFEGSLETRQIDFYTPVPTTMAPNDDLDLQVIDLEIIRRFGLPVNRYHLSDLWNHLQDGGPDEYGAARWNVALGRYAPLSGYFCNRIYAGMGAAIRSELWACLAPGNPALAVKLSREDACTDHYADGMEACVFLSAVESAAFCESVSNEETARRLIETGLSFIPENGRLYKGIRYAIDSIDSEGDPYKAREKFLAEFYVQNWTDVTINLGLIAISWLAAKGDFDKSICIACGLGYDTDCTCATLGSIIGIIDPALIGEKWLAPIGDRLVLSTSVMGMHEPDTIGEFCELVADTALEISDYYGSEKFTGVTRPDCGRMHSPWTKDIHAADRMDSNHESLIATNPLAIRLIYPFYVSVKPGETSEFRLVLRNTSDSPMNGSFTLSLPDGWVAAPSRFDFSLGFSGEAEFRFRVTPPDMTKKRPRDNDLDIDISVGGINWKVTADIPVAFPWERTNLDTGITEMIDSREIFQRVPAGHYRYRTAVKVNPFMPVKFGVYSNRAFRAKLNGKEIASGDGSFYVPAFHRGNTGVNATTGKLFGCWNFVEIEVMDGGEGELFFGLARPHNCCEWLVGVEYSLQPLEWLDQE